MRHLFILLLVLAAVIPVGAHLGNENNTEVRVYSDKLRVVLRTSIPFAWNVLGEGAPAVADEAGQVIAKPLLIAAAPGLISVTAGGKPLTASQVDCMFEVEKDVAFILNFERPTEDSTASSPPGTGAPACFPSVGRGSIAVPSTHRRAIKSASRTWRTTARTSLSKSAS